MISFPASRTILKRQYQMTAPLPFVPYDDDWPQPPPPIAFREMYELSLCADPAVAEHAAILETASPCDE